MKKATGNRQQARGKMQKSFLGLVVFMLVVLGSSFAHAVLTKQLSYQGRLLDASGLPVPNGTYTVVFNIYNVSTGGAPLWTETQNVVLEKGGFSAYLGSVVPLNVPFTEDYFLGIKVGADPEMTPRLKLAVVGASAFALDAGNAGNAANLGGQPPSNYASVGHTHSFGSLTGAVAVAPSANQIIQPTTASVTPLGIKGQTGQSVPYFTVEDNAGGKLFSIQPDGHVLIPASNQLHVANINNDSPAGPMGDINVDITNNAADSLFRVANPDLSFSAKLFVEGDIQTGGNFIQKTTPGTLNIKAPGSIFLNASDATVPTSVNIFNDDATQVANLSVEGIVDIGGGGIKHNAPGTFNIILNDAGNTILNITNPGTGTASLQVEGATVVTSVNGLVANPSATQNVVAQNAATTPLSVKSAASPTAPIFEVLDDASVRKFAVMSDGHVFIPGNNQLHVLNVNNDSPTGPMGNMVVDVMDATADSKLILQNSDPSFNANLAVEGKVLVGAPTTTTAKVSAYETGTTNRAGYFEINNASSTMTALAGKITSGNGRAGMFWVNSATGTGTASFAQTDGTGSAGEFVINNVSNSAGLIIGSTTGTGNLFRLITSGADKFVVANNGNLSFGSAVPVISATGAGANITLDANSAAASTVTITNSGIGVAKLSVEGNIAAFNGSNATLVTNSATQQLIQSGNACEAAASSGTITVAFSSAFSAAPILTIRQTGGTPGAVPFTPTTTGFTIPGLEASVSTECFDWIAIGNK